MSELLRNPEPESLPNINCGEQFAWIGGYLITATQCFDDLGRLLLMETDAAKETLLRVLETHQFIQELQQRISADQPTITAAERLHT